MFKPTETILANLYREVPYMFHVDYQLNQPRGTGEEAVCMFFTIYEHDSHLEFLNMACFC